MNSITEIRNSLLNLTSFHEMLKQRHKAYYERKENLDEFVVLGAFLLDSCGNCFKSKEKIYCDDVLTKQEFNELFKDNHYSFYLGSSSLPAPDDKVCCFCKKNWTIENCTEIETKSSHEIIDLKNFIGLYLSTAIERLKSDIEKKFYFDMDEKIFYKNSECINPDESFIIGLGDKIEASCWTYKHKECVKLEAEEICKKHIENNGKDYIRFPNLAGRHECDIYIKTELQLAGINIIEENHQGEVPYHFSGKLNDFTFHRAWYYWIIQGNTPLDIAEQLYINPEGQKNVRVAGHCGRPAPEVPWVKEIDDKKFITSYHIDSLAGLKLFADTIRNL